MDDKQAFGRGVRNLRLARGLPQEAFSPAVSVSFASVIERGAKMASIDKIGVLAKVLNVHPMSLLAAMYVEKEGVSVPELLSRVEQDFQELASQLPTKIGKDPRTRDQTLAELKQWFESCMASRDGGS